jgi:hypothetical protein
VVRRVGGPVDRPLNLITGFTARVPVKAVNTLRHTAGVAAVPADGSVRLEADQWNSENGDDSSLQDVQQSEGARGRQHVDGSLLGRWHLDRSFIGRRQLVRPLLGGAYWG